MSEIIAKFAAFIDHTFQSNASFLTFLLGLFTLLIGLFNAWNSRKSTLALRRLDDVVSELFDIIEPYMLRDSPAPSVGVLQKIHGLMVSHTLALGGTFRSYLHISPESLSLDDAWVPLFRKISGLYDALCFQAGIKLRPLHYRAFRYKRGFTGWSIAASLVFSLLNTVFAVCVLSLFFCFIGAMLAQRYDLTFPIVSVLIFSLAAFAMSAPRS